MDNKTFLETLSSYFPRKIGIRIYHQSSPYFYQYQLNQNLLDKYLLPFYYVYHFEQCGDFIKGDLVYLDLKYIDNLGVTYIQNHANKSVLNDFVKFKLKLYNKIHIFYAYRKEDLAADTIKSAWKKHRWNYLRNLAAVKYHPSKIDFTI
jgi:hypothetical protein